jgi:large subunit ribosomal protein L31
LEWALAERPARGYACPLDFCKANVMKLDIHPNYREVVFQDGSADFSFLTRSTIQTKDKITWTDGKEYPLVKVETSSKSHPFYTGKQKATDTGGRVDKFRKRYAAK